MGAQSAGPAAVGRYWPRAFKVRDDDATTAGLTVRCEKAVDFLYVLLLLLSTGFHPPSIDDFSALPPSLLQACGSVVLSAASQPLTHKGGAFASPSTSATTEHAPQGATGSTTQAWRRTLKEMHIVSTSCHSNGIHDTGGYFSIPSRHDCSRTTGGRHDGHRGAPGLGVQSHNGFPNGWWTERNSKCQCRRCDTGMSSVGLSGDAGAGMLWGAVGAH